MPSQRTGTKLPTRVEQKRIQEKFQLKPIDDDVSAAISSAQAPSRERRAGTKRQWIYANNPQMQQEFSSALMARLRGAVQLKYEEVKVKREAKELKIESLQGAADAAKQAVDAAFAAWAAQAALPPKDPHDPTAANGKIVLLDSTSDVDRNTKDTIISARDMARYLAFNDRWTQELMAQYKFDPSLASGTEEERKFLEKILNNFVELDSRLLYECDRLGYNLTRPGTGKIFVTPFVEDWDGADETAGPAMQKKYDVFMHVIHEYIHLLEHPLIPITTSRSMTVREGVCEWLTCQVIRGLGLDKSKRGTPDYKEKEKGLRDIVKTTEGKDILTRYPGRSQALGEYLAMYQPKKNYADYVAAVQEVVPICGENGVRAAFLQGHVEFLGLTWNGDWLAGAIEGSDGNRSIPAPTHIQPGDVTTLAKATGLPPELIRKNNPGLGQAGNESKQLFLPGYHGHLTIVVGAQNQVESWAQIANQHNVSEDRLRAANLRGPNDPVPENSWLLVPDQGD